MSLSLGEALLGGRVAAEADTATYYYPLAVWASDWLRQGQLPLWAPHLFGGYPIFADGELGLSSPLVLLALLSLPPDSAFILLRLLHLAVAAIGCYLLARVWRLSRASATLAGLVFALGSFMQAQIHHENVVRSAAWLPLALTLVEAALRSRGRARLGWTVGAGLALGLAALGLHPQILAIDLLVLATYGAVRWWVGPIRRAGRDPLRRLRAIVAVFPAVALLGLALAAVQLIPLAELAAFSPRGAGVPYPQASAYALTPPGLVQMVFPFFFRHASGNAWSLWPHWESYLYVGVVPLALVLVAATRVRQREVWAWLGLGLVGLVLALGQYSPLNLHYLFWLAPGGGAFRAPGRFTLLVVLALAMLAAYGLTWLQRSAQSARPDTPSYLRSLALAVLPALALAGMLAALHLLLRAYPEQALATFARTYLTLPRDVRELKPDEVYAGALWATNLLNPATAAALSLVLAVGAGLWAWRCAPWAGLRRWRGWPAALVLLTAADLLGFSWGIHPRVSLAALVQPHPAVQALRERAAQAEFEQPYRVLASPVLVQVAPNRLAPLGLQEVNGYTSLQSRWHRELAQRVLRVDDELLDLWNVRFVIEPARYGRLSSAQGVSFLPQHALLHGPANSPLGQERFSVPPDTAIHELRLVSAMVDAVEVPQDTPVAEIVLRAPDGSTLARTLLLAGRDTMEWGWDHPAIRPNVRHQRVEVADQIEEMQPNGRPEPRLLSFARVAFDQPISAATIQVRSVLPRGEFILYGAALADENGTLHQLFGRHKDKYQVVHRDEELVVLENTAAYPRAFLVPRARVAPALGLSLEQMVRHPFQPRGEVILAPDSARQLVAWRDGAPLSGADASTAATGSAAIHRYGLHEVELRTSAEAESFLVLSDTFYPGWSAYVDGQKRPLLRGDVIFRVVPVPAGAHTVSFRFEPASVHAGLLVSGLALLTAAVTLLLAAGSRSRAGAAPRRGAARTPRPIAVFGLARRAPESPATIAATGEHNNP